MKMKQNSESVAGLWFNPNLQSKCPNTEAWTGTESVQHSFKVHSVSVYFSALRKIEKKVKQRTFVRLKCRFMLAFTVRVGQKESLDGTNVFTELTLKQSLNTRR